MENIPNFQWLGVSGDELLNKALFHWGSIVCRVSLSSVKKLHDCLLKAQIQSELEAYPQTHTNLPNKNLFIYPDINVSSFFL